MLDSGWDRHCYCQISRELKLWHASSPLGISCMSVRWKQLGTRREEKQTLNELQLNYGYESKMDKKKACKILNLIKYKHYFFKKSYFIWNYTVLIFLTSPLPVASRGAARQRIGDIQKFNHSAPVHWPVCCARASLQKSEVSWPPSRCPILE